jgi:hypothetical protein
MQVIEVDNVVMNVLDSFNQIADYACIRGNFNVQGILNASHGGDGMNRCSDPSYPLSKGPSIPWVAPLQDYFNPPPHSGGAPGIHNFAALNLGFNAQVSFNTGYGIKHIFGMATLL